MITELKKQPSGWADCFKVLEVYRVNGSTGIGRVDERDIALYERVHETLFAFVKKLPINRVLSANVLAGGTDSMLRAVSRIDSGRWTAARAADAGSAATLAFLTPRRRRLEMFSKAGLG